MSDSGDITQLLGAARDGDRDALGQVLSTLYHELPALARRQLAGQRGNTLDAEDLWAILEDPEAEPELRAAAARVLRHSTHADARVRIENAVAAVRDDATNKRLRIAVRDDLDGASQELAFLDANERLEAGNPMMMQQRPPMYR